MAASAPVLTTFPDGLCASDLGYAPGAWPDFIVLTGEVPGIVNGSVIRGPILYSRGSADLYKGELRGYFYMSERGKTFLLFND